METQESRAGSRVDRSVRFNFQNVPLDTVLDHLSRTAGFVIMREVAVKGNVDAVSHQALSRQEAYELLNTILKQQGYAAIRNENVLRIVTLEEASRSDMPVKVGRDSAKVAKSDTVVTQIIPLRHVQASALVQNLSSLMPSYATLSTNEASNALVLTATQSDVRHMLQIIEALDITGEGGSTLRLFQLEHADATNMASLITELYKTNDTNTQENTNAGGQPGMPPLPPEMMMMAQAAGGGSGGNSAAASTARKNAIQTTAVADTRTNTVAVVAADDLMPKIEALIKKLDADKTRLREIQIFHLRNADATTLAEQINSIFQQMASSGSGGGNASGTAGASRLMAFGGPGGMGGPGGFPGDPMGGGGATDASQYDSTLVVPDVRTNSIIVSAEKALLGQIAPLIERLDNDPAKSLKVTVYQMKYADAQKTAVLLQNLLGDSSRQSDLTTTDRGGVFSSTNSSNSSGSSGSSSNRSSSSSRNGQSSSGAPGGMSSGF